MINIFFLFDANYLAPALVSAVSFFSISETVEIPVTLVYIATDPERDLKASQCLQAFESSIKVKYPNAELRLVVLKSNQFSDYVKRFHFSQAILYKAAIPILFKQHRYILLFDCGMIFGNQVNSLIRSIIECSSGLPIVGAFCGPPDAEGALSKELQARPHNSLYPSAAVLFFDVDRYNQAGIYSRYLSAYINYRDSLLYAEQDLLCLVLNEEELNAFSDCFSRYHIDLASVQSWGNIGACEEIYVKRDYLYLKHIGSFKPWKKWVLHPAKSIYLREQHRLGELMGSEVLSMLYDNELLPSNPGFLAQQLVLLENYYEIYYATK